MIEQLKAAYTTNNRVKIAAFAGLLLCAVIFAVLSGGFPPWAWRFLFFTVLPSLPRLLALQGGVVFLPLLGLLLLSLSLLIVWVVIVTLMIKMGIHLWQVYHSRQNFNMDLREAEQMAEQNLAADELDRWFEEDKSPANRQRTPLPISGATNSVYSTQAKRPQMREYIAAARAAGGSVYPETPTPISNPTLLAPSPVPVARERPGLWTQQGSRQNGERNAEQTRIYNTTKTTNTVSLPSYNNTPPANPTRKQLRIVPPPPVEEISTMDTEHSIDSAFSALIKRGQREQTKQPDPLATSGWLLGKPEQREQEKQADPMATSGWLLGKPEQREQTKQPDPMATSGWLLGKPEQREQTKQPEQPASTGWLGQLEQLASSGRPEQRGQLASPEQSVPLDISRYPTHPARGEVDEEDDIAIAKSFTQSLNGINMGTAPAIVQPSHNDPFADFDPSTNSDAQINIYDTIPFDESKILKASPQSEANGMPRLVVGIGLDPGIKRRDAPNEDSIFAIQGMRITDTGAMPAGLFVVADGMGGHINGREASRIAIHTVSDVVVPALLRDVSGRDAAEEETIIQDMLKDGVHRANLSIYRRNRDTAPDMMGTTLTAALIANATAYIGNVGDSRTYLYRPSEGLKQVTRDHSEVARLVESGAIAAEEIYTHPKRNRIYRCLGERASVDMDLFTVPLIPGDVLLLCSDGLWEMVRDPALEKLIAASAHNPTQMSAILVQAALNHGGLDNISVVVVGYLQAEG